jgi:hypothetical protein
MRNQASGINLHPTHLHRRQTAVPIKSKRSLTVSAEFAKMFAELLPNMLHRWIANKQFLNEETLNVFSETPSSLIFQFERQHNCGVGRTKHSTVYILFSAEHDSPLHELMNSHIKIPWGLEIEDIINRPGWHLSTSRQTKSQNVSSLRNHRRRTGMT